MSSNLWKQQNGILVRNYATFILQNQHEIGSYPRWNSLFIGNYRPNSIKEWFLNGMFEEISKLIRPGTFENLEYLSWNDLIDIAQDAEFLMTLIEKKKYHVTPGMPVSNPENFRVDHDGYVIVYTDGACPSNGYQGATAGIGVWFGPGNHLNVSEPLDGQYPPTNQVAEIRAAIKAIQVAKNKGVWSLEIRTDSKYLYDSITIWIFKWLKNGWHNIKGEILGHRSLFRELLFAMEEIDIKWVHVRGHNQDQFIPHREGNNAADFLAREGAKRY